MKPIIVLLAVSVFVFSVTAPIDSYTYAQPGVIETFQGIVITKVGYEISPLENGCHALISLASQPATRINVITEDIELCDMLGDALITGKSVSFKAEKLESPPSPPEGGQWANLVYNLKIITLSK